MNIEKSDSSEQKKNDSELIKLFLAGEDEAFDILVLRYQDRVFRTCLRMLGNHEDADDTAQEAFVKVFGSLNKFKHESRFSTWLYAVTVNTCKNKLSSSAFRKKKQAVRIDLPVEHGDGEIEHQIPDESLSPGPQLERREKALLIQSAIDSLSFEHKQVVVLRDVEALSYEDIADATGYNLGTVKSKLARAREQLRKRLKELI